LCPSCRRKGKIAKFEFSGQGTVFSYSYITSPPSGYESQAPYMLALVELAEGPKVLAQIADSKPGEIKIGTPVRMCFRKIREDGEEGIIHYGYKFVVASNKHAGK